MHSCRALRACEVTYLVGASAGVIAFDYSPETLRGSEWSLLGSVGPVEEIVHFFYIVYLDRCNAVLLLV